MTNRIHLGLDLRGGTHLILQVQVNDAVNIDSDNAIEILKEQLNKRKIAFADISKPDAQNNPDRVVLKGVPPDGRKDLLDIVSERLPEYNLSSGADNTWTLSMKPQMLSDLKNKAVTQAIETIRNRIDSLGVSEPTIQEHGLGQYQILVQLPGVDDPGRVKDIMQSTAMLEIKQVLGGPFPSEQAALQDKGGILPADAILMPGHATPGAAGADQVWYLVSRVSAVRGKDLRDAQPSTDQNGQPNVRFQLTGEGGQRFYSFTSAHVGESLGVVLDGKVQEVANIKEAIRDTGEISGGSMNQQQAKDLSMILRSGALPAGIKYLEERTVGTVAGHRFDPLGSECRHHRHARCVDFHADLLPCRRHQRRYCSPSESCHPARLHGLRWGGVDPAGNCRSDSHRRYGRGLQCADLRAHPGRAAKWQDSAVGGGSGLWPRLGDDR